MGETTVITISTTSVFFVNLTESGLAHEGISEGRAVVVAAKDMDESKDDEAVINPEDPESPVPRPLSHGRGQEGPCAEAGPEVEDSLEEAGAPEDCESTKDIGCIAKMKGKTPCWIKAPGHHPVAGIENPDGNATPAHKSPEEALTGFCARMAGSDGQQQCGSCDDCQGDEVESAPSLK